MNTKYIGDGVYLSDDGYQLWLSVNHHENKVVAMELEVFAAFVHEGKKLLEQLHGTQAVQEALE